MAQVKDTRTATHRTTKGTTRNMLSHARRRSGAVRKVNPSRRVERKLNLGPRTLFLLKARTCKHLPDTCTCRILQCLDTECPFPWPHLLATMVLLHTTLLLESQDKRSPPMVVHTVTRPHTATWA